MKFRNFNWFGSFQNIQLIQSLLFALLHIQQSIIGFDNTGAHFYQRIFAKERICNCLPNICGFRLGKIIISLKDLIGLLGNSVAGTFVRAWEIAADIIEKIGNTAKIHRRTHAYRNDGCFLYVHCQCSGNFCYGESISLEISVHKFLAGLCHGFHKDIMIFLKVFFQIIRNFALFLLTFINIFPSGLFHNIYIAYKFTIFTNWEMKWCDLLAVKLCQLFYNLTVTYIVNIHVCDKDHSRKFIFLT